MMKVLEAKGPRWSCPKRSWRPTSARARWVSSPCLHWRKPAGCAGWRAGWRSRSCWMSSPRTSRRPDWRAYSQAPFQCSQAARPFFSWSRKSLRDRSQGFMRLSVAMETVLPSHFAVPYSTVWIKGLTLYYILFYSVKEKRCLLCIQRCRWLWALFFLPLGMHFLITEIRNISDGREECDS